jgi:hypothetical protein
MFSDTLKLLDNKPIEKKYPAVEFFIDEMIWGHRLLNDSTPWMAMLEFLNLFKSRHALGQALNEPLEDNCHENFTYCSDYKPTLRTLIFGNPSLFEIAKSNRSDSEKWSHWITQVETYHHFSPEGLSFLKDRFETFDQFTELIRFFQDSVVEPEHSNRRWTSKFIFPFGPDAIYTDALYKNSFVSGGRRFFGRNGELLYLMLNRAKNKGNLAERIETRLLNPNSDWNKLARVLNQPSTETHPENITVGYLPHRERIRYDRLSNDWLALLEINAPQNLLLDALVRISGLHLALYLMEEASLQLGEHHDFHLTIFSTAYNRKYLRDLSVQSRTINARLTIEALKKFLKNFEASDQWQSVPNAEKARNLIKELFRPKNPSKFKGNTKEAVLRGFRDAAIKKHKDHLGKVANEKLRKIGLILVKPGVGKYYDPTDTLLRTLVLSNVKEQLPLNDFLHQIWLKYRLVIGPIEAKKAYGGKLPIDRSHFDYNVQRVEQRLRGLGLLKRLSDDCAFVTNPFMSGRKQS